MKQRINEILQRDRRICLPSITAETGETLCRKMHINMDNVQFIARYGSLVDWIAKRADSELLIGLSDGWLQLTEQQRERIEQAGKSFMIWRTDLITDWVTAIGTGQQRRQIELQPFGIVTEELQVCYWVYHNRYGWQNGAQ